jgi:hypothetical protein
MRACVYEVLGIRFVQSVQQDCDACTRNISFVVVMKSFLSIKSLSHIDSRNSCDFTLSRLPAISRHCNSCTLMAVSLWHSFHVSFPNGKDLVGRCCGVVLSSLVAVWGLQTCSLQMRDDAFGAVSLIQREELAVSFS